MIATPLGGQGSVDFSIPFALNAPATITFGSAITATATDSNGNTSEFSKCFSYVSDEIFKNGFEGSN